MLTVVKKSGFEEQFNSDKIKTVLAATSDEAGKPLNDGDLKSIINELTQMLDGKKRVTSRHIYIMLVGILYHYRMYDVVKHYTGFPTNAWLNLK